MTESAKSKILLLIIALLLAVIGALIYKFIIAGAAEKAEDGRMAIVLAPSERAFLMKEMRDFVAGVQRIADALSRDDMDGVAKAARGMGKGMTHEVPAPLMAKLPLEFKTLGFSVHGDFDQIALDAADMKLPKHTLGQVAGVLQKCVACHNAYQVRIEAGTAKQAGPGA